MQVRDANTGNERGAPGKGAPALDPTDRAFFVGLLVVVASVVSAVVSYFILMGSRASCRGTRS